MNENVYYKSHTVELSDSFLDFLSFLESMIIFDVVAVEGLDSMGCIVLFLVEKLVEIR
jgi:hypothetical protein